jgi:hypothetical protein
MGFRYAVMNIPNLISQIHMCYFSWVKSQPCKAGAYYIKYCKILNCVIKEAKWQHYCRLIAKSDNKIKTSSNIIKYETKLLHLTEQIPAVLINGEKVKDLKIIANAVNKFFLTITENLNLHQELRGDDISFLEDASARKFPGIKTIPITETEIKSLIQFLKAKNSSGYDGITSKILKVCASLLSHPLTNICNHTQFTGIFPNRLKISIIRSLYKKGDKTSMSNYRPISLLTTFSKVLEKVMYNRLVPEQFGFRKGISTENAAFKLTDNVFRSTKNACCWNILLFGESF